jgi:hypothetical protein
MLFECDRKLIRSLRLAGTCTLALFDVDFSDVNKGRSMDSMESNNETNVWNGFEFACEQFEKAENRLDALRKSNQRNAPDVNFIL